MIGAVEPIILAGEGLRIADVVSVARDGRPARLPTEAYERIRLGSEVVRELIAAGERVDGLTTGVGALRGEGQTPAHDVRYSRLALHAHRTARGAPLPAPLLRAARRHRVH